MITVVSVKGLNTAEERRGVCYVGRAFAGWPASPLGNPFKGPDAVAHFAHWLAHHPDRAKLLADVWEACGRGAKPLGCWCLGAPWVVNRVEVPVCHAQVIALHLWELIEAGTLPARAVA